MAEKNWGNCKNCRYFSSDSSNPQDTELARCMQPTLRTFDLLVAGATGCNAFEARAGVAGTYEAPAPAPH